MRTVAVTVSAAGSVLGEGGDHPGGAVGGEVLGGIDAGVDDGDAHALAEVPAFVREVGLDLLVEDVDHLGGRTAQIGGGDRAVKTDPGTGARRGKLLELIAGYARRHPVDEPEVGVDLAARRPDELRRVGVRSALDDDRDRFAGMGVAVRPDRVMDVGGRLGGGADGFAGRGEGRDKHEDGDDEELVAPGCEHGPPPSG